MAKTQVVTASNTRRMLAEQAKRAKAEMDLVRAGKFAFKVNGPAGVVTVKVIAKAAK